MLVPKYLIENQQLARLHKKRLQLNHIFNALCALIDDAAPCYSASSFESADQYLRKISNAIDRADWSKLNQFDNLILQDIKVNIVKVRIMLDFLNGSPLSIQALLKGLYGDDFEKSMISFYTNQSDKMLHEYSLYHHKIMSISQDPAVSSTIEQIRQTVIPKLKTIMTDYITQSIQDPALFEYSVDILPFSERGNYWNDHNRQALLDVNTIHFDKKTTYYYEILPIIFHEICGHGLSKYFNETFMPALSLDEESYSNYIHGVSSEGLAIFSEYQGYDFIQHKLAKYGVNKKDLNLMKIFINVYLIRKSQNLLVKYYLLLDEQNNTNEAVSKLNKAFGTHYFNNLDRFECEAYNFFEFLSHIPYIMGIQTYRSIYSEIQKIYGPELVKQYHQDIVNGFYLGCWASPDAQRDFILSLYVPSVIKKS